MVEICLELENFVHLLVSQHRLGMLARWSAKKHRHFPGKRIFIRINGREDRNYCEAVLRR